MIVPVARNLNEQQKEIWISKNGEDSQFNLRFKIGLFLLNLIEILPAAASSWSRASAFPYVCMSLGRAWVFGLDLPTSSLSKSTLNFRDYDLASRADVARYYYDNILSDYLIFYS